jgi:hypothetical protein
LAKPTAKAHRLAEALGPESTASQVCQPVRAEPDPFSHLELADVGIE